MKKNSDHHFYIDGAFSILKSIIFDVLPIEGEKSSILSTRTRIERYCGKLYEHLGYIIHANKD